jgi:hypothetical protein
LKRTSIGVLCALAMLSSVPAAGAAINTTTTGRVCCPHFAGELENFGGYTFKGKTTPSLAGQFVFFQYKRPAAEQWRFFKVGLGGSDGAGFYVLNRDAPRDRINRRDRWRILFTPSVRQGHWKIRALFPAQDGYARSMVVKKYWVNQSE